MDEVTGCVYSTDAGLRKGSGDIKFRVNFMRFSDQIYSFSTLSPLISRICLCSNFF